MQEIIDIEFRRAVELTGQLAEQKISKREPWKHLVYPCIYSMRMNTLKLILEYQGRGWSPDVGFIHHVVSGGKYYGSSHDARVNLSWTKELLFYRSPGFISRAIGSLSHSRTTRIYLALKPVNVIWFLSDLFDELAAAFSDVSAKALANPRAYGRSDAGVIYLPTAYRSQALKKVDRRLELDKISLRRLVPLGVYKVRNGFGWADCLESEVDLHLSFGQWISQLIIDLIDEYGMSPSDANILEYFSGQERSPDKLYCAREIGF